MPEYPAAQVCARPTAKQGRQQQAVFGNAAFSPHGTPFVDAVKCKRIEGQYCVTRAQYGERSETADRNAAHAISLKKACRFMIWEMPSESLFQTASGSILQQHRAPRETAADAFEQQVLTAFDLSAADARIQSQRNRCGGCVAVVLDGQDDFVHTQT